ncbi:glucokinase [Sediminicoccus sp. KRV36]|uniref:glucokinase n=1 Tax=Sediminicoccus sp. KRV36 TaxID=3133721 RepID=UPI00200FBE6D|nr:glucokinase [Sediminicoccus rosea]UPY36003.1 glucokinase [Sediminicoccus rosea]
MTTLIGDIGGTQARFALAEGGRFGAVVTQRVADHPTALDAMRAARARLGPAESAILAIAGPIEGQRARLTNGTWAFDAAALAATLGLASLRLVNDLEAMACALPALSAADVESWQAGVAAPEAPQAIIAPGTGLGVAGFLPGHGALPTEAGHIGFAPRDATEAALLAWLQARQGAVSAEDFLSGIGLVTLHDGLAELRGVALPRRDGAEISAAAEAGCPVAREAVAVFGQALGGFCGDVALSLGARGGVYLAGGVAQALAGLLPRAGFLERFQERPRMRGYLARIPVRLIRHPQPGLLGLAQFALKS